MVERIRPRIGDLVALLQPMRDERRARGQVGTVVESLDAATVLVVVATSAKNVKSKWVKYEWNSFFEDILADVKPDGRVFTYLNGVSPKELPINLRQVQSFEEGDEGLAKLHRFIKNVLTRPAPAPTASF